MAQPGFRIDAIEPTCFDKTIQQGSALTAMVAAEEDKILFPKEDGTKGSFGSVVIRLCQIIITVVAQCFPLSFGAGFSHSLDTLQTFADQRPCRICLDDGGYRNPTTPPLKGDVILYQDPTGSPLVAC